MPLPGFTAIQDATASASPASFLGVIVSIKDQKKTRGTDWVLEFTIQDDFTSGSIGSSSSINCRLFRRTPNEFPKISGIGDVALVRAVKLESFNGRVACVVSTAQRSGVLVFHAKNIPVPELSQAYQLGNQEIPYSYIAGTKHPTTQEQMAVIHLKHAASAYMQQVKQHAATTPSSTVASNKLCLIKDFEFNRFYDVRVQVVNVYYNNFGSVDLKVTDYTSHPDLFLYVEPDDEDGRYQDRSWKGPYGQLTLDVKLYGSNSVWARDNVTNGDFVLLKNLRTKLSPYNKLEGALHEDRQRPDQVDIRKLISLSDVGEINKRRKEYELQLAKKTAFEELQNVSNKPSAKATAKKRAEKKEKLRLQKEQEQKEIAEKAEGWEAARSGINLNSE
jgi:protection-of-telomeres protein 1